MHVCMYVCMHVCIYVCVCMYVCVCVCICVRHDSIVFSHAAVMILLDVVLHG